MLVGVYICWLNTNDFTFFYNNRGYLGIIKIGTIFKILSFFTYFRCSFLCFSGQEVEVVFLFLASNRF